jgi:Nucleotidyl transferase AbiEii toxin, Type IV TA system
MIRRRTSPPVPPLESVLARLDVDLRKLRYRWALVGGVAVSARTEPRTTRDIDVAVAVDGDWEAEKLVAALTAFGYRIREGGVLEQQATGRLATVRLQPPGQPETGILTDLLFASSGIEPEVVAAADRLEVFPGLQAPVAIRGHLLALKVLAEQPTRPQDLQDALALIEHSNTEDLQVAREAVELITRRGYERGKDLRADLGRVLAMRPDAD